MRSMTNKTDYLKIKLSLGLRVESPLLISRKIFRLHSYMNLLVVAVESVRFVVVAFSEDDRETGEVDDTVLALEYSLVVAVAVDGNEFVKVFVDIDEIPVIISIVPV